jgi:peptidoglycan/xylan/chitin deacetylase (PgdA/CDA1 family)
MQIGAHTMFHPILARLTDSQARHEIGGSKDFLEQLLGERVGLFAYPNGKPGEDYTAQNVETVRSLGFDAAFSTQWGASSTGDDVFQIRRFTPWDQTNWRFGLRMLHNFRT